MKSKENTYETAWAEVMPVEPELTIAVSNLENPEEGGEWSWD